MRNKESSFQGITSAGIVLATLRAHDSQSPKCPTAQGYRDPVMEDREDIILRLGMILRMLNQVTGETPAEALSEAWRTLMKELRDEDSTDL